MQIKLSGLVSVAAGFLSNSHIEFLVSWPPLGKKYPMRCYGSYGYGEVWNDDDKRMKDEKDENLLMGDRFSRPCVNIELVFL